MASGRRGLGYTPGVAVHHHAPPPRMHLVRQRFDATEVADFDRRLTAEARAVFEARGVGPGSQIAMAVGSRGVSPIAQVVRLVSESVQSLGGEPFIVPAMGSHGGGTAAGQAEVLAGYGISEAALGVPVRATMETVELGATDHGVPVHMDAVAAGADGIVVIGRDAVAAAAGDAGAPAAEAARVAAVAARAAAVRTSTCPLSVRERVRVRGKTRPAPGSRECASGGRPRPGRVRS